MIPENKYHTLQELIRTSTQEEIIWINGYINGIVSGVVNGKNGHTNGQEHTKNGSTIGISTKKMTIAYGTETGNSKKLALQFSASAKKEKISVKCVALEQYRHEDIIKEDHLFIVISTQGEGEPPETAKKFIHFLEQFQGRLEGVKYSVLALGDTSYPLFCKTGEDVDNRLKELGAECVHPIVKCDVDYEEPAAAWYQSVSSLFSHAAVQPETETLAAPAAKKSARKNIQGTIAKSINLNDRGSQKETYHMEIVTDEEMDYEPGDSIAVIPANNAQVVNKLISISGVDAETETVAGKYSGTVRDLLLNHLNICYLLSSTVKKYAALTGHTVPDTRMDLVDLLRIYPVKDKEQFLQVVGILNPIAPRLYSVSSSAASGANEVHITVSRHRFLAEDEQKFGLCSSFLGDLPVNTKLNFYIHRNRSFKLPAPDKDIIMVGPGTGIAPFRSFLADRDVSGAGGRNWLIFGEQHFQTDFLYQTEIQQYLQTGVLHKVNLAFSRDQEEKIYVQHRMLEHSAELYKWLSEGAIFYVSGTKDPMSHDVEKTLLHIIRDAGNKTAEEAVAYLDQMKKEDRYHKDVY